LGIALRGHPHIYAIAGDTDGVDGQVDIAGAILGPNSLEQARILGVSPVNALDLNDAHSFFKALGASVITGPTYTNVNDFRAILLASS
jgi:hydroxypyruvate reductase